MGAPPFVLVPPSEGKAEGGRPGHKPGSFDDQLAAPRQAVATAVRRLLDEGDNATWARVFKARGDLLERAVSAWRTTLAGEAPVLPAWRRYTGVVWGGLDPGSLSLAQRRRLLVPSAFYGITTAEDPVVDYRLTFLVSLTGPGPLARYWQPMLTEALAARVGRRPVVDLLPAEHAGAIDWVRLGGRARICRVRFLAVDGQRAAGHAAKAAKGALARLVVDEGADAIASFGWEGWRAFADGDSWVVVAPS